MAISTILAFVISAVLLVSFFLIEKRTAQSLLDLSLLRSRPRLAGLAVMTIIVGMHFSVLFLIVQYLQHVLGFPPLMAGLGYLPLSGTMFAVSSTMPRFIAKFGVRALLGTRGVFVAASCMGFAMLDGHSAYFPDVLVPLVVHAIGVAFVFTPGTVAILEGVPDEHAGAASGLPQMDQQAGGALGLAIVAAVYASNAVPNEITSGLDAAFAAAAAISILSSVIAMYTAAKRR